MQWNVTTDGLVLEGAGGRVRVGPCRPALLVDVRQADEFASRHIPGSLSLPLSLPDNGPLACGMDSSLIFTPPSCR